MIKLNSDYGNGCNPSFGFEKKLHLKTKELKFRSTLFKGLVFGQSPKNRLIKNINKHL